MCFSGSSLAYDLSLRRVRERLTPAVGSADWAVAEPAQVRTRIAAAAGAFEQAGRASGERALEGPGAGGLAGVGARVGAGPAVPPGAAGRWWS
ncbi:hypothetical protein AB0M92_23875 [Streptomyces sp. NPDC051582]|uniref:hypothetical protein n=1 Tax=Streptomyces sp. NPDC051582 TaxID=3155167 RepID=UPI00341A1F0A